MPGFAVIITAAGLSRRMGGTKKELLSLNGECFEGRPLTVLGKAALTFALRKDIAVIVIAVSPSGPGEWEARSALPEGLLKPAGKNAPRILFVPGGPTRRSSVHHGLSLLEGYHPEYVLIHDGARPWVSSALIDRVMDAVVRHGAAIPLIPLTDTPKETGEDGFIIRHLRRTLTGGAQTPQAFRFPEILRAHEQAAEAELAGKEYTDDAEIWGEFLGRVAAVPGEAANRKITYPEDLENRASGKEGKLNE